MSRTLPCSTTGKCVGTAPSLIPAQLRVSPVLTGDSPSSCSVFSQKQKPKPHTSPARCHLEHVWCGCKGRAQGASAGRAGMTNVHPPAWLDSSWGQGCCRAAPAVAEALLRKGRDCITHFSYQWKCSQTLMGLRISC